MNLYLFFKAMIFSAGILSIPPLWKHWTCGFKLSKIFDQLEMKKEFDFPVDLPQKNLFEQTFFYLDRGAQSYVFASEDGKWVIKLFRYDHPLFSPQKKRKTRAEKIEKACRASLQAFQKMKEKTGLVYVHLNPTNQLLPELTARGPLGQMIRLPLDRYRFILQKRALPLKKVFQEAYEKRDGQFFDNLIDQLISLITYRMEQGIVNRDPTLFRNFGVFDQNVIEIDFGSYDESFYSTNEEIDRYTKQLLSWVEKKAPDWKWRVEERIPK